MPSSTFQPESHQLSRFPSPCRDSRCVIFYHLHAGESSVHCVIDDGYTVESTYLPLGSSSQSTRYTLHIMTRSSPPEALRQLLKSACRSCIFRFPNTGLQSTDFELSSSNEGRNIELPGFRKSCVRALDGQGASILYLHSLTV